MGSSRKRAHDDHLYTSRRKKAIGIVRATITVTINLHADEDVWLHRFLTAGATAA